MGPLKTFCGVAVAVLALSGCGNGSGGSSPSSSVSSNSQPVVSASQSTATQSTTPSTPAPTNNSATLTWTPPTTNTNGSALTDLAGYEIHYGTSPGALTNTINIANPGATTYVVTNLTAGTWYFAMSAYTNTGLASPLSNVGSKTIS